MRIPSITIIGAAALLLVACSAESPTAPDPSGGPKASIASSGLRTAAAAEATRAVFIRYAVSAPADRVSALRRLGAVRAYDVADLRIMNLRLPDRAIAALAGVPWVERIEVAEDDDDLLGDLVPWGVRYIGADTVHPRPNRGTGVRIGILDSGINCNHPDLVGRVKGGYDFVAGNSTYCHSGAGTRHGTAVAGIIAARADGAHLVGVAPEADLYSLRVCDSTGCPRDFVTSAISWARKRGLQVLNASLGNCGKPVSSLAAEQVSAAYAEGIVLVFAAGNGSHFASDCSGTDPVSSWLALPAVIGVSAHDAGGVHWAGAQYGPEIELSAPHDVASSWYIGTPPAANFPGTSAAVPHVSGTLALLLREGFTRPDLLRRRLAETARDLGPAGRDIYHGFGSVYAGAAVVRRPRVTIGEGEGPIRSPGYYDVSAEIQWGVAPVGIQWSISYSNGVRPNIVTSPGAPSQRIEVPEGSYTITVTATPHELVYLRQGSAQTIAIVVCTDDEAAGREAVSAPGIAPMAVGGCVPPPIQ